MKTRNTTTKLIALAIALSISAICTFPRASRAGVVRDTNSSVGRHSRDVRALTPQKANPCAPRGFQPFTNPNLLQNFSFNTVGPLGTSTTFSGPLPNVRTHQDVAKDPDITNITIQTLAAAKKIFWSASEGDSGSLTLSSPLAPGKSVQVTGQPGQVYSCKAWTFK
jgi:hypothetical protein